jgi:NH3-dependent NAD+ synthetase
LIKGDYEMDAEAKVNYLVDWLRQQVKEAGFSGAVLGLSGGVDSAVAARSNQQQREAIVYIGQPLIMGDY